MTKKNIARFAGNRDLLLMITRRWNVEEVIETLKAVAGIISAAVEDEDDPLCMGLELLNDAISELKASREQKYEKIYEAGFYDGECYYAGDDIPGELPKGSFFFHKSWSPNRGPEEAERERGN
jgi:hypothetical protein